MAEMLPNIAKRIASLDALRHYCQNEIWCVRGETRNALRELAEQKPESVALNLQGMLQNRADAVNALCSACDPEDNDAIKKLRTQVDVAAAGTTVKEVLQEYYRFFETDFGRKPNPQEGVKLERMAIQACSEMLPLRLAIDQLTFAYKNAQRAETKILERISGAPVQDARLHPERKPA